MNNLKEGMFSKFSKAGGSNSTVAYFCAEYAITDTLPIYSGGLGVLAGDVLQAASDLKAPLVAVGLFYRKGYFHQYLQPDGQHERYEVTNPNQAGLELILNKAGDTLLVEVPINERTVFAQVWKFKVGNVDLYLMDTDHWKNSEADRHITEQLYGGDINIRIQQELVLAIGGYRALKAMEISPVLYHMNEGHSAFLGLELIREKLPNLTLENAIKQAKNQLVFTNHTLVPAGNDLFTHDQVGYYLGKYAVESRIGLEKILELGRIDDQPGKFSMTLLALRMAKKSNAVSKLHAKKAVDLWPGFPFKAVTNGVHLPAWVAPELQQVWTSNLPAWKTQTSNSNSWKGLYKIPNSELWTHHRQLKEQMLTEVYARTGITLDPDVLTVVWARRFATYKRPDLLFSDLDRLRTLLFSEKTPIQIIIAGKSHPADGQGKQIIEHIDHLANYELKHRAVFVDDYSISLAKFLVSGADVWLNTPIFGLEASGTSGMKAAANGVLQFTVPDGWAYEVDWYGLGFTLPIEKAETEIYSLFEKQIIPAFYKRNAQDIPEKWVGMMKRSIATISPYFSSIRMVEEYMSTLYR